MTEPLGQALQSIHRVGLLLASVLLLALVLECVRRGWLKERYALLWLAAAAAGLVIGLFPRTIVLLSRLLSLQYLTVLFMLFFLFMLALVLAFTIIISRLSEQNRNLTQEVGLLAHEVDKLKKKS